MVSFTVLVSEGERCEVIGFIKKGECLLRRYIDVAHTFPNGKKVSIHIYGQFTVLFWQVSLFHTYFSEISRTVDISSRFRSSST